MQRSLRLSLSLTGVAALALASTPIQPVVAQGDGSAADLGVMEINLKDAVQFNWGFQGAIQKAQFKVNRTVFVEISRDAEPINSPSKPSPLVFSAGFS